MSRRVDAMHVLLIKMSSLGDVIHALPAVTDAAAHGIRFDWVVEEAFADIPAAHAAVADVLPVAWRRWRGDLRAARPQMQQFYKRLRARPYDLVLDAQGLIKSAVVSALARGPVAGQSHTSAREPWSAFAYRQRIRVARDQHAIDRQRQLFAAALGYELSGPLRSGLEHTSVATRRVMLLHGTTWETKHYPLHMWQGLARLVSDEGFEPVVTWGDAAERERAQQICDAGGATLLERAPLQQLMEHLRSAALVIGVDSGLAHLSAALGTPTLGLFGPTDGMLTGCRGTHAQIMQADTACSPCLSKRCRGYTGAPLSWQNLPVEPPCFGSLQPERIWAQGRQMLVAAG